MADIRKFKVEVTQLIEVEIDASKFDEAFMEDFRSHFYNFDTIDEHVEHLAQIHARGVIELDSYTPEFIEGYGPQNDFGIKAATISIDIAIEE